MLPSLVKFYFGKFNPSKVTCWNCKSNEFVNRFICGQCKYLKDPTNQLQNVNYFEIFDLGVDINVETKYLEEKYRSLQLKFHPDRFVTTPQINISYSQEYSAFINEAYSVLKNIHERAEYILSLKGFQIKECSVLSDVDFMEEILEQQSMIQNGQNIKEINSKNQKEIDRLTNLIIQDISSDQYERAYQNILYLKYRQRLRDQIALRT